MDTHIIFQRYLCTIPDAWIAWPEKGKAKLQDFFYPDLESPNSAHYFFDDLFDYIKEETLTEKRALGYSASEWIDKYFHTVRGREMRKAHMARHEPHLAYVAFNIEPLKSLMDGFILYVISEEVLPCMKK
jgi:hypothetical protein